MHAGARQANENAEFRGCPLRIRSVAVAAIVIIVGLLDGEELEDGRDKLQQLAKVVAMPWGRGWRVCIDCSGRNVGCA